MNKERFLYIDVAKGLGITLMFLGHMKIDEPLLAFISSFHMPLFILISGFLFRADKPLSVSLKHRAKALLLPYLYTNLSALLVRFVLLTKASAFTATGATGIFKAQTKATLLGMGFARNLFTNTESIGPIWFVPFLFCVHALFLLIEKVCANEIIEFTTVISLSFLGFYIGTEIAFLPWSFDASLVALPLFYAGRKLNQHRFFDRKYIGIFSLFCAVFWILLYRKSGVVSLVTRSYGSFPLCLLVSLAGSIFILYLLQLTERNTPNTFFLKPLAWCGRHSMLLLGVHTVELWHIGWLDTIQSKCPNLLCSFIVYFGLLVSLASVILSAKQFVSHLTKQ